MRVLVTVKAYPGLGRTAGESVCVAGVRLDTPAPEWVRLWPVSFRELPLTDRFKKWQVIELEATKARVDSRPESYTPNLDSIRLGAEVASTKQWAKRREALGPLIGQVTLCELQAAQVPGRAAPSLGLVKVLPGASARVVDGPVWEPERVELARHVAAPTLLRPEQLTPLAPPKFQMNYRWRCASPGCPGHEHVSCDWEVGAAARNWERRYPDPRIPLLEKFGEGMLRADCDTHFFVGNQHQRPRTFMVIGAFYPRINAS